MSARKAVHEILSESASVTGMVAAKIFYLFVPQETAPPFIAFNTIDTMPTQTKDGPSSLDSPTIHLACYHNTVDETEILAGHCRDALERFSGTAGGKTVQTVTFIDQKDGYDSNIEKPFYEQIYKLRIEA